MAMLLASSRAALRGLALARIPALATRRSSAMAMDPMAVNLQPSVPMARSEPAQDVDDLKWIARYRVMLASTTAGDGATALLRARGEACSVNACALATRSKTEVNMIEDLRGSTEGVGCKQRTKLGGSS